MVIVRLKKILKKIDAKIIIALSSDVKSTKLSINKKSVDFTKSTNEIDLLKFINSYDKEVLKDISRSETNKTSTILLPGYIKFKKILKPKLKAGLQLAKKLKARIL